MWTTSASVGGRLSNQRASFDNRSSPLLLQKQFVQCQDPVLVGGPIPLPSLMNGNYFQSSRIRSVKATLAIPELTTVFSVLPIGATLVPAAAPSLVSAISKLNLQGPVVSAPQAPSESATRLLPTMLTVPQCQGPQNTLLVEPEYDISRLVYPTEATIYDLTELEERSYSKGEHTCRPIRSTSRYMPYAEPRATSGTEASAQSSLALENPVLASLLLRPTTSSLVPTREAVPDAVQRLSSYEEYQHHYLYQQAKTSKHEAQLRGCQQLGQSQEPQTHMATNNYGRSDQPRLPGRTLRTAPESPKEPMWVPCTQGENREPFVDHLQPPADVCKASLVEIFSDDTPSMVCCGVKCTPSRVFIEVQNRSTALGSLHTQKGICIEYRLDLAYQHLPDSSPPSAGMSAAQFWQSEIEKNITHGKLLLPGLRDRTYRVTSVISTVCAEGVTSSTTHTMTGTARFAYCLPYSGRREKRYNSFRRPLISPTMVEPAVAHKYFWFFTPIPDSAVATLLYRKAMTRLHYLHVCGVEINREDVSTYRADKAPRDYTSEPGAKQGSDDCGRLGGDESPRDTVSAPVTSTSNVAAGAVSRAPQVTNKRTQGPPPGIKVTVDASGKDCSARCQQEPCSSDYIDDDQVTSLLVAAANILHDDQHSSCHGHFQNQSDGKALVTEGLDNLQRASAMSDHMTVSATSLMNKRRHTSELNDNMFLAPRTPGAPFGGLQSLQVTLEESGPFGNLVPMTYRSYKIIFQV